MTKLYEVALAFRSGEKLEASPNDGSGAHAHIEKLEAALREIASASKVVARNENIAEALAVLFASHRKIAREALED